MAGHQQGQAVHAVGSRDGPNGRWLADSRGDLRVAGGLPRRDREERIPDALLERGPGIHDRNSERGRTGAGEIRIQLGLNPIVHGRSTRLQPSAESPLDYLQLRLEHRAIRELEQCQTRGHRPGHHGSESRVNECQPNDTILRSATARPSKAAEQGQPPKAALRSRRIPHLGAAAQAWPEAREERVLGRGETLRVDGFGRRSGAPVATEDPGGAHGENGHDHIPHLATDHET